jgi:hypothetical protein
MKLQVYEATAKKEEIVRLKLSDDGNGDIDLFAVDEGGYRVPYGWLLTLKTNGMLLRHRAVSNKLGFDLDCDGCIKFENE